MSYEKQWKQHFHLEPPQGFLNDPNGLCHLNNEYHIYFQYCKENAHGTGLKSWGHYKTTNFLHYDFTGETILPDTDFDKDGAYSGSAMVDENTMHIYYTGNTRDRSKDGILSGRGANVIYVNSKNGHDMSPKKVLLENNDYPNFCSCHVRDPKVWKENGAFYMVLGARDIHSKGLVLIYKSENYTDFKFINSITTENFGYMWECPDFFTINNKNFLLISPQGLEHFEFKNQNVYQSGYLSCNGDIENISLNDDFCELDMGFDFYAPQTFLDNSDRRILIGWFGLPDADYKNPTAEFGIQHCLTIPRIVTENNCKLYQNPIEEFIKLRKSEIKELKTEFSNDNTCDNTILNTPFELVGDTQENFKIIFDKKLILSYEHNIVTLEFLDVEYGGGRNIRKAELQSCKNIRMLVDKSSLEIFLNDGELVMSSRFYPTKEISLDVTNIDGKIYQLDSFNIV